MALLSLTSCEERPALKILSDQGVSATPASLVEATLNNQAHLIQLLTQVGVRPDDSRDADGRTALMIAARNGYAEALGLLVEKTQNFDIADSRGMTALAYSVCNDQWPIAGQLLRAGASANAICHTKQPLLVSAVMRSEETALDLLLEHGAKAGMDDALLIAVTEGKIELAEKLLQAGASPDAGADAKLPVLNVAMQNGNDRCVDLLIEAGANPNAVDDESMSAFGYAIAENDAELVSELMKHSADLNRPCKDGLTAVAAAIESQSAAVLKTLITEGKAEIIPAIVTSAVDAGSPEILEVLLDHGTDIDTPDSNGDTLLARAVRTGDQRKVELLIGRGANPKVDSHEGQPLLALATALKKPDVIVALIKGGADPNLKLKDPISDAYRELVDSRTFSFYSKRDSRFTPLMVAASHGHADTVRALKQNGASTGNYTRNWKRYPISFASEARNIEAQQLLVGYDPLHRKDAFKIVIDLSTQRAVMYKNGLVHMSSQVSTGKSGYRTPTGEYVVTHKHRAHTSTLYGSSMPYFMRFSCKAFGTHTGYVPNYPASHGCIRMPNSSARAFFNEAPRGTPVSIVN
ncbi:MAG: ankyrin repeat protein [Verrucomicrobiales bacterium]|jgi:ankyrin repeat protein